MIEKLGQLFFDFFLSAYAAHRDLHSFPTRRSSDLVRDLGGDLPVLRPAAAGGLRRDVAAPQAGRARLAAGRGGRSEEHTSELQSRLHLVCRLLLEKKNSRSAPMAG